MNIGIIGTGKMGRALAAAWARTGHRLFLGSRDRSRGEQIAEQLPPAVAGGAIADAASFGDVIVLAVPWTAVPITLAAMRDSLADKTLIDCTNPFVAAHKPLMVGRTTSGAEQIRFWAAASRVVKAFNAISARVVASGAPMFDAARANVFFCGDDEHSRTVVAGLISDIGFAPVDAGPLTAARYLEPLAAISLLLDLAAGPRVDVVVQLLRRPWPPQS